MKFRWEYSEPEGLSLFDQIKKNRNLTSDFFSKTPDDLPSPELLNDLEKTADRLIQALQKKEKIFIFYCSIMIPDEKPSIIDECYSGVRYDYRS